MKTPPYQAIGRWVLEDPFHADPEALYRCEAIRSLRDLEIRGNDPYRLFYEPKGISKVKFDEDYKRYASIITLGSETQRTIYVPDTYIKQYPDVSTFTYHPYLISVNLGYLPKDAPLEYLVSLIKETLQGYHGLITQPKIHKVEKASRQYSLEYHDQLERKRKTYLNANHSIFSLLQQEKERSTQLTEYNELLIEIIQQHPELFDITRIGEDQPELPETPPLDSHITLRYWSGRHQAHFIDLRRFEDWGNYVPDKWVDFGTMS